MSNLNRVIKIMKDKQYNFQILKQTVSNIQNMDMAYIEILSQEIYMQDIGLTIKNKVKAPTYISRMGFKNMKWESGKQVSL